MNQRDYEIVAYRPAHGPGVAQLHALVSTPDPQINAAHLAWKYDRNPYLQRQYFCVALYEGQVVGMGSYFGTQWEGGGTSQIVPSGGDLIIAPEHRHRGLFSEILRWNAEAFVAAGGRLAFSLSAISLTASGSLTKGWRTVSTLGEWRRERTAHAVLRSAKRSVRRSLSSLQRMGVARGRVAPSNRTENRPGYVNLARAFEHFDRAAASARVAPGVAIEKTVRARAMASLVERLHYDGHLRHRRDETYLGWRYANPLSDYRFVYTGHEPLEGYLVLGAARYGRRLVSILDWEATTFAHKRHLLETALVLGRFSDITACSFGLDEDCRRILAEFGFVPVSGESAARLEMSVMVREFGQTPTSGWQFGNRDLLNPDNWQFRLAYADCC
jgi:hypothetical protein